MLFTYIFYALVRLRYALIAADSYTIPYSADDVRFSECALATAI